MSLSAPFHICLVGCGGVAAWYRHKYTEIAGADLKLIIDVDAKEAEKVAKELNVQRWSTDFSDALQPDIDMVDISTPNNFHESQAVSALEAGKHIIVQKPLAPTVGEAINIVQMARATGLKAGMYMSMLNYPLYHDIRRLIGMGLLGTITGVHCRGASCGGLRIPENNWRKSLEKTGGGSFIQLAIHPMNMAQWLLNDKIKEVAAFSKNCMCPNGGGDDVTCVACEFESGIQGTLESSYCSTPYILAIYGHKGFLSVVNDHCLTISLEDNYQGECIEYTDPGKMQTLTIPRITNRTPNVYDQHQAFVKAVMENKPVPVDIAVGLYDVMIVQAVYTSAKQKRFVNVKDEWPLL